jgi:hypothetical protein
MNGKWCGCSAHYKDVEMNERLTISCWSVLFKASTSSALVPFPRHVGRS